jgi:sulfur-oxidizing protein SoxZ
MASNTIKIRAKAAGDTTEVKALIQHVMETGLRKDPKTGEKIPAHYIQEVVCAINGDVVCTANWGVAVSKNPYLSFKVAGAKAGDKVKISWKDNKGDSDSAETDVV